MPYMGSKSSVAGKIIESLPSADSFVDLFGGGGAITHAAVLSGKYKNVYYNEIDPLVVDLFKRAINGDFNYDKFKPEFITRDRFFAEKDKDGYISVVWSFGNNKEKGYLFGKDIEKEKCALHNVVIFGEFSDLAKELLGVDKVPTYLKTILAKRLWVKGVIKKRLITRVGEQLEQLQRLQQLEQLQRLERLQQLEQLERLQQLERLEPLNFSCLDYKNFPLIGGDVIYYCDPPYKGTERYSSQIDHDHFFNFAAELPYPCYVSEYDLKDNRFVEFLSVVKRQTLSATNNSKKNFEKVYVNKVGC